MCGPLSWYSTHSAAHSPFIRQVGVKPTVRTYLTLFTKLVIIYCEIFKMANLSLFVSVLLLAVFVQYGESIRCWTCDSKINPHCQDPFLIGHSDSSYFMLENCDANTGASYPYLTNSKSACKKIKKYEKGMLVISRGCTWKRTDDFSSACPISSNDPDDVTYFCETCDYDGCNGAATIGKTLALLLAPLGLLLFK